MERFVCNILIHFVVTVMASIIRQQPIWNTRSNTQMYLAQISFLRELTTLPAHSMYVYCLAACLKDTRMTD